MDKDKKGLNEEQLNQVLGGMANPIYTAYFKDGALRNPESGKPFKDDKEAWEYFRAHK
ncbi:MAG: hypothetical protein RUMPE_00020 [Eubacteriales bacterium SKADARSKE-1]|nr:hypothetical protein [Eubacteriales bacterium SKADARSKE-1]